MENLSTSDFIAYQVQTGHSLKKKEKAMKSLYLVGAPNIII